MTVEANSPLELAPYKCTKLFTYLHLCCMYYITVAVSLLLAHRAPKNAVIAMVSLLSIVYPVVISGILSRIVR